MVLELRRSNENLEQFAYVASHDLQEPLRKIQSFGDVLHQQYGHELSDSAADIVQRMRQAAARMRTLVQDLLAYSRVTGQPDSYVAVDTNQLVRTVLAQFHDDINAKQALVQTEPLPPIWGDAALLRQLFQNLISNALKFVRPAVSPTIQIGGRAVTEPADPNAPGISLPGTYVEVTVSDNGIGFDEKYLDRIFTIFQRLHGRNQYTGTGIGLAICKKISDVHGGAITARSRLGHGTTFTVYLPAA